MKYTMFFLTVFSLTSMKCYSMDSKQPQKRPDFSFFSYHNESGLPLFYNQPNKKEATLDQQLADVRRRASELEALEINKALERRSRKIALALEMHQLQLKAQIEAQQREEQRIAVAKNRSRTFFKLRTCNWNKPNQPYNSRAGSSSSNNWRHRNN